MNYILLIACPSFVYVSPTRYVGRTICNQLMSKEEVDVCLLNGEEPTYFGPESSSDAKETIHTCDEPLVSDPWPES